MSNIKKFLHVGCGPQKKQSLKGFQDWSEIRFDIDPQVSPDILGSLTGMTEVKSGEYSALYSSHNIEHVFPHEVPIVLKEFYRVLNDDGFVIVTCPDLQSVGTELANGRLLVPLYESPSGPISAIDIIYGHRGFIAGGNNYMAHKTGFTFPVLSMLFSDAGFAQTYGGVIPQEYAIWMIALKKNKSQEILEEMARSYFP